MKNYNNFKKHLGGNSEGYTSKNMDIIPIIEENDLLKLAYDYVVKNNKSNNAPYHNITHILTVAKYVYLIASTENLPYVDLILAALFHDVNHSMGKEKDSVNVNVAISTFYTFADENNLDINLIDKIASLIKITEYPYTIETSQLNFEQQILRDADLLQRYEDNWYDMIIVGLSKEMNQTLDQRIAQEKTFSFNPIFTTKYANYIKDENDDMLKDKITKL